MKCQHGNEILDVVIHKYGNGRPAIKLIDVDGLPYATATINVPTLVLADDEVVIKDYAENKGIYQSLVDAGVISEAKSTITVGFEKVSICNLNVII